jgi:hypothetical protein
LSRWVLKLHQLTLESEELPKVCAPVDHTIRSRRLLGAALLHEEFGDQVVVELHFEFLVVAIDEVLAFLIRECRHGKIVMRWDDRRVTYKPTRVIEVSSDCHRPVKTLTEHEHS